MSQEFFEEEDRQKLARLQARYPSKQPLILAALHLAQKRGNGVLSVHALEAVAEVLDLSYPHVYGVATFYTMFRIEDTPMAREPVTLRVCTNISCMLRGAYDVLKAFEGELGIKAGQDDGRVRLVEEECIAACANAPAIVCGANYFLDVEPKQAGTIVKQVKANPDRYLESEVA